MIRSVLMLAAAVLAFGVNSAQAQEKKPASEYGSDVTLSSQSEGTASASYQLYDNGSNSNNTSNNTMVNPHAETWFGNDSIVAITTLSSYVTGVDASVTSRDNAGAMTSGVTFSGNSLQNSSGISTTTVNTGTGASQVVGISINVTH